MATLLITTMNRYVYVYALGIKLSVFHEREAILTSKIVFSRWGHRRELSPLVIHSKIGKGEHLCFRDLTLIHWRKCESGGLEGAATFRQV